MSALLEKGQLDTLHQAVLLAADRTDLNTSMLASKSSADSMLLIGIRPVGCEQLTGCWGHSVRDISALQQGHLMVQKEQVLAHRSHGQGSNENNFANGDDKLFKVEGAYVMCWCTRPASLLSNRQPLLRKGQASGSSGPRCWPRRLWSSRWAWYYQRGMVTSHAHKQASRQQ